jgi:hypothetical protein
MSTSINATYKRWEKFYGISHETKEDEIKCLKNFQKKYEEVTSHNNKFTTGNLTYEKSIYGFAGLNFTEFKALRTGL